MKKLFVLILIAVVVGFFISQTDQTDQENDNGGAEGESRSVVEADTNTGETGVDRHEDGMRALSGPLLAASDPVLNKDEGESDASGKAGSEGFSPGDHAPEENQQVRQKKGPKQNQKVPEGDAESVERGSYDLQEGLSLMKNGQSLKARKVLTKVYREADGKERERAHGALQKINSELVFNPRVVDGATIHTVQSGEVLSTIARKYGVNWRMIQRVNGIDRPGLIRVGQELKILDGPQRIVVDKSDFRLALYIDGEFIKEYEVGLGKNNKTPEGEFEVEDMLIKPDWYPPWGGIVKYGDEEHLIGVRWIGLSDKPGAVGYGIHGTNDPDSIGTMCSNGCIRLINEDVKELYDFVKTGATVIIKE